MTTDTPQGSPPGLLERLIRFAIAHRWLMLGLTLALVVLGAWSFTKLPIDATPDITNVQVQINTFGVALQYRQRWQNARP